MMRRLEAAAVTAWNIAALRMPPRSLYHENVHQHFRKLRDFVARCPQTRAPRPSALDETSVLAIRIVESCYAARSRYDAQQRYRPIARAPWRPGDEPLSEAIADLDRMIRVVRAALAIEIERERDEDPDSTWLHNVTIDPITGRFRIR